MGGRNIFRSGLVAATSWLAASPSAAMTGVDDVLARITHMAKSKPGTDPPER